MYPRRVKFSPAMPGSTATVWVKQVGPEGPDMTSQSAAQDRIEQDRIGPPTSWTSSDCSLGSCPDPPRARVSSWPMTSPAPADMSVSPLQGLSCQANSHWGFLWNVPDCKTCQIGGSQAEPFLSLVQNRKQLTGLAPAAHTNLTSYSFLSIFDASHMSHVTLSNRSSSCINMNREMNRFFVVRMSTLPILQSTLALYFHLKVYPTWERHRFLGLCAIFIKCIL